MRARLIAFGGCILVVTTAAFAEDFRRVPGSRIASLVTGREFTDEVHSAFVFERGGLLRQFVLGRSGTGKWHVAGEELCLERGADGDRCFEVWTAGRRMELRREAAPPEEGILQRPRPRD